MSATYVHTIKLLNQNYINWRRSEKKLNLLRNKISFIKAIASQTFGTYQSSRMRVKIGHAFDHISDAIRKSGKMTYLHVKLFKSFHEHFESFNRLFLERARSLKNEGIQKEN